MAIGFLLILSTMLFADVLFLGKHIYIRDLTRFYYPTKQVIREVLQSGEMPYWNRHYSAGQPIAANPEYEIFYPPQLLVLLPDYDLGYRLHIVLHLHVAAVGMYLFLRSLGLRRGSALFGSISFAASGLFFSLINLLPILFCAVWIPLVLLFGRRFLIRPNLRDYALTSLFLGMQLLAAEPTTLLQTWTLLSVLALYRSTKEGFAFGKVFKAALLTLALIFGGWLIGAAQFIPALDHVGDSARARPFDFSLVTSWSLAPARLLELVFPNVFGHISRGSSMYYWGGVLYPGMGVPFFFSLYIGLFVLALAAAGVANRRPGWWALLGICFVSILIALGSNTPLFRWLYDAGLARSIRYPEKFTLMGLFATIVFGSKMFERVLNRDHEVTRTALGIVLGVTLFSGVLAIIAFTPFGATSLQQIWGFSGAMKNLYAGLSRMDWTVAVIRGLLLCGLLWLALSEKKQQLFIAGSLLFVLLDVVPVAYESLPRIEAKFFTPPPIAGRLDKDVEQYRIFHETDWYGSGKTARQFFSTGDAVYWVVRNGLFPMTTASWGFRTVLERDYDKTALLPTIDLTDAMWKVKEKGRKDWYVPFMQMSNARYRSVYRNFASEKVRTRGNLKRSEPVEFLKSADSPSYYFAEQLQQVAGSAEFVNALSDKTRKWSSRVGFVEGTAFVPAKGVVDQFRETPNTAKIDVTAVGRSFLIMSVTRHKYWKATLDGKSVPLVPVNIAYQGVEVPAGKHIVEMRYRNPIVDVSFGVSVVSTLTAFGVVIFTRRRRDAVQEDAATTTAVC